MDAEVFESREQFVDFLETNNMMASNTTFEKTNDKLATWKNVAFVREGGAPWTRPRYETIDYIIIEKDGEMQLQIVNQIQKPM